MIDLVKSKAALPMGICYLAIAGGGVIRTTTTAEPLFYVAGGLIDMTRLQLADRSFLSRLRILFPVLGSNPSERIEPIAGGKRRVTNIFSPAGESFSSVRHSKITKVFRSIRLTIEPACPSPSL